MWHCQLKSLFLCLITEASSRRLSPDCRQIKHFLGGSKESGGWQGFSPESLFGRCAFPMGLVVQPRVLTASPAVPDGVEMGLAAVP